MTWFRSALADLPGGDGPSAALVRERAADILRPAGALARFDEVAAWVAEWQGRDRFESSDDHRVPLPLPEGVACFTVAATLAGRRGLLADRLTGDGLVPLQSALGQHDDPARQLIFAKDSQRIVYRTGHLDLLSSPDVAAQLLAWLQPRPPSDG